MENEQITNLENRPKKKLKIELFNDSFQNFKRYQIPKAQLVIADIPYNIGTDFYGSNPVWYKGGDNKNGESDKAKKAGFYSDFNFNIAEYFHFCNRLLKKDNDNEKVPRGRSSNNPCMIVFCSFEQLQTVIKYAKKYGFVNYIPISFIKNYSPQVLKANMRVVGATEYALILYRSKLPKFRNVGSDGKNHGDIVIDPCAGSGTTLRACKELNRSCYGFEIHRPFYERAVKEMLADKNEQLNLEL